MSKMQKKDDFYDQAPEKQAAEDFVSELLDGRIQQGLEKYEKLPEEQKITLAQDIETSPMKKDNGKFSIQDKVHAIFHLEVMQREYGGNMVPRFSEVGRELLVPESTLRLWWDQKEAILDRQKDFTDKVSNLLKFDMAVILSKMVAELNNRDFKKEKLKDIATAFSVLFNKLRLLDNKSTSNIEKHEKVSYQTVPPELKKGEL